MSRAKPDRLCYKAVKAWYKNHTSKLNRGDVKPKVNPSNPLWKAMAARKVSPMRLWASNHRAAVAKEAGADAHDVGARSHCGAQLWRGVPEDENAVWVQRAAEHKKAKEGQCFL